MKITTETIIRLTSEEKTALVELLGNLSYEEEQKLGLTDEQCVIVNKLYSALYDEV